MSTLGYSFVSDNDESLMSKGPSGQFGGNFGAAVLESMIVKPGTPSESNPAPTPSIEVVLTVHGKKYINWFNAIDRLFKDNNEITDKSSEEYKKAFQSEMSQMVGVLTHILKAVGVQEEAVKATLAAPIMNFTEFATRMVALLPAGYNTKTLDIFLEYQWNFGKKKTGELNEKTFLIAPKNMKGGYFVVPAQPGVWNEVVTEEGVLTYVNQTGALHPFTRSADYMKSPKANQQTLGQAAPGAAPVANFNVGSPVVGQATDPWATAAAATAQATTLAQ